MSFQLVRASESDIAVWQTEHGHVFGFQVCPETNSLKPFLVREAPDATEPAALFAAEALQFATEEALLRNLIVATATSRSPSPPRAASG